MSLNELFEKLYYSLDSPASYGSLENLYKEAKKENKKVTKIQVRKWLEHQLTYTLHRPIRKTFKTKPVIVHAIDSLWQGDLVDLSKLSKYNNGYKYLLVIIDVLSKYAFVTPLKTKTGQEIKLALENIFHKSDRKPKMFQTDKGKEFLNFAVATFLKKHSIKLFTTNSERKASVVERLNRTLKSLMFKYFTKHNTRRYIDILPDLVKRYNNAYHRSIKMIPSNVTKDNDVQAWINLYEDKKIVTEKTSSTKIQVGDTVRISIERGPFRKSYLEGWSEEIFIVSHVLQGEVTTYKLKDQANEEIKGVFYREEVQKVVEPDAYRIEKVLKRKKNASGKLLYLVKWRGYPAKFNNWIFAEDLA